jgi:hypothetical protein
MAPRGSIIFSAGDTTSVVEDLPPTIEEEVVFRPSKSTTAPKGIRFIAARVRKWTEWRHFFTLHGDAPARDQPKLLTHSGHRSVTLLQSDNPLGQKVSADIARATIKRIT